MLLDIFDTGYHAITLLQPKSGSEIAGSDFSRQAYKNIRTLGWFEGDGLDF